MTYGLIIVLATWAGAELAAFLARKDRRAPEHIWRALLIIVPFALIGARLWFVLFPPDSAVALGRTAGWMLANFFDLNQGAIAVWASGLGIIGGVLGGLIGLLIYLRRNGLPIPSALDYAAVGLALGQTIGRFGNFVNQDLYGPVSDLPWALPITNPAARVGQYSDLARYPLDTTFFHPVWLYEAMLTGLILIVLLALRFRRGDRLQPGDLALTYLLLYSGGRFLLEFLRVNVSQVGGVNISQLAMAACLALAVALLWRQRRVARM